MSQQCHPTCKPYLPKARRRREGQVHFCRSCRRLYVCAVFIGPYSGRVYYQWEPLDGESRIIMCDNINEADPVCAGYAGDGEQE